MYFEEKPMYWKEKKGMATIDFSRFCAKTFILQPRFNFWEFVRKKMYKNVPVQNGKFTKDLADSPQSDAF